MKNRGSVTIFCCLIISAMVFLGITVTKVVGYHLAEAKGAVAVRSAMSGVDAGYNSYVFDKYHILLFDRSCNGRGEAYLEEQLLKDTGYNLGQGFTVEDICVSDYKLIMENNCEAFKKQMEEYCGYALLEGGAESILESTNNQDGTLEEVVYEDMESAKEAETTELPDLGTEDTKDPRDYTKDLSAEGILSIVVPEDMEVSSELIPLYGVPSIDNKIFNMMNFEIDNDFTDMDILKADIGVFDSWKDGLLEGGAGLVYGGNVFNCATEEVQEDTVFKLELEYIICGKDSDKDNLKGTVNRILGIRFSANYGYLVSDSQKMAEIKQLSWPIALATLVPEPVVRYLLAGCWAYMESIFDVRCLLEGQKMDFMKTKTTWKTDLNDLEKSSNLEAEESASGLEYKDYLIILMAMDMDDCYYRMLDIIELNTRQYYKNFDMNNAAVGFIVDAHIKYDGKDYYYSEGMGY